MSFDHHHYMPILLTKRGERSALRELSPEVKELMTPLFVVPPVAWDFDNDEPTKSIDAHLQNLGKDLATSWGSNLAAIDLLFVDGAAMADGTHPLVWLTDQANEEGAQLMPTVSIERGSDYLRAAAHVIDRDKRGVCIRLWPINWPTTTGTGPLDELLDALTVSPADADLVLDLADGVVGAPGLSLTAARNELAVLPYLADWRSVTVAGAGFPKQLADIARGITPIERREWSLHRNLLSGPPLPRTPTFGDYAIAHPDPVLDVDPKFISLSANIRYTIDDAWLVAKGELFKGSGGQGRGGEAAVPLAKALVADSRFAGASHCAGDAWLASVAAGTANGGNPEYWRRVGTAHHLTHVGRAVASLP